MPTRRFALAIASSIIGKAAINNTHRNNNAPIRIFRCNDAADFAELMTILKKGN